MLSKIILALIALLMMLTHGDVLGQTASARAASAADPARVASAPDPARLDSGLVHFFVGDWTGEGSFANGKAISASVTFRLGLDSSWLECDHHDVPPGKYAATLFWGVDRGTGKFVAYAFDNFQGHREFASAGWAGGRIVLTGSSAVAGVGTYFEHFIYERISDIQFKMTYETSRDAVTWRLGDSLLFKRKG